MSIRVKLIITYIICVIVSASLIVFSIITGATKMMAKAGEIVFQETKYDEAAVEVIDLLVELKQAEDYDPLKLVDKEFIQDLDLRLANISTGIIVYYQGNYINATDISDEEMPFDKLLPTDYTRSRIESLHISEEDNKKLKISEDDEVKRQIQVGDSYYNYIDYAYNIDGNVAVYFFLTDVTGFKNLNGYIVRAVFIVGLALILLILFPVIIIVQTDIIRPLKKLEYGSVEISKGNLDFEVKARSKNEVGKVIHSYETMRQELKKSIEKQVLYENNRKELISSISHDLKTPMTSIKGYVEGILDGVANTEEKRNRYLRVIKQKSLDMEHLIDDLFTFSKLDLKQLPFEFEETNMEKFIRETTEDLALEYSEEAKIDLTIDKSQSKEIDYFVDKGQLRRALYNLVQNSIKYNVSDEKHIDIILRACPSELHILVKDNGLGMEKEELSKVFDIFYRTDSSRNTKTGGSGIGLAIVKEIVFRHGGKIKAKSEKGIGTIITLVLSHPDKKESE